MVCIVLNTPFGASSDSYRGKVECMSCSAPPILMDR